MIFPPHPLRAHAVNRHIAEQRIGVSPCDERQVAYAAEVVGAVHGALLQQYPEPWCKRPEYPVDGWALMSTDLTEVGTFLGALPLETYIGSRVIYLANRPKVMRRVLMVPDRRGIGAVVASIRRTSVPSLLREDPTMYTELVASAEQNARAFGLECIFPEPPF